MASSLVLQESLKLVEYYTEIWKLYLHRHLLCLSADQMEPRDKALMKKEVKLMLSREEGIRPGPGWVVCVCMVSVCISECNSHQNKREQNQQGLLGCYC